MIKRLICIALFVYVVLLGLLYIFQREVMYKPSNYNLKAAENTMLGFQQVELEAEDGVKTYGWEKITNANAPLIIYFHGNAETVPQNIELFNALSEAGYNIFAMEYRGYGKSHAATTEEGIYQDARTVIDHLRKNMPESRIIVFGRSLGTGVAVRMASEYNLGGVVLQSAYTSIEDIAAAQYPYFPIKRFGLLKDRYDSLSIISGISEPVLIIHGRHDMLVPFSNAETLMANITSRHDILVFDEADHINGVEMQRIINEINKFFMQGI